MEGEIKFSGGVLFHARAGSGHTLNIEGPSEAGGGNRGFRPMELMLLGLGGCMALDVLLILQKMRQEVTSYTVRLKGERADEPPRVYTAVDLEHIFQGSNLKAPSVQRAIELAEQTYCSALAMFSKTAKINNSFRILEG